MSVLQTIKINVPMRGSINERIVEYCFVLKNLPLVSGRKVVDIGAGQFPALWYLLMQCGYHALATDFIDLNLGKGFIKDNIVNTKLPHNYYDGVFSISTIEHIRMWEEAIKNISMICAPGGIVIVTFPYNHDKFLEDYTGHNPINSKNVSRNQAYSPKEISIMTSHIGTLVTQKFWKVWSGKHWRCGSRFPIPIECESTEADLTGIIWKTSKGNKK